MTNPLDFSGRTVLVVGGSSGIGNGVAHGFREAGAEVHVWGTRPSAEDYAGVEGSDGHGRRPSFISGCIARVDLVATAALQWPLCIAARRQRSERSHGVAG